MKTKLGSLSKMKLLTVRYSVAMRGASNNETRFPNWFILLVIGLSLCVEYFTGAFRSDRNVFCGTNIITINLLII